MKQFIISYLFKYFVDGLVAKKQDVESGDLGSAPASAIDCVTVGKMFTAQISSILGYLSRGNLRWL